MATALGAPALSITTEGQTFCHGGALNLAGSVTARKNQRATTSDWMDLEKHDRGTDLLSWTFCHETQSG